MASEDDNFDIDIYGDGGEDYGQNEPQNEISPEENPKHNVHAMDTVPTNPSRDTPSGEAKSLDVKQEPEHEETDVAQKIASTDQSTANPVQLTKQAPQTQGLKRKDGSDERPIDPGATSALFVSELNWWVNDDDIRGWANQSQCEDELDEITFSEHKVNGKSKGQAYVLFKSPQAATATKQKIESFGEGQYSSKKFTVSYTNPYTNPFKTLPKDGPLRNNGPANNRTTPGAYGPSGGISSQNPGYNNNNNSGYRGNRGGGYNNRGGMNNMSGFNRGGFRQNMGGGFQGSGMGGFQGGTPPYGGFQGRGGMGGSMRGGSMGRGGMNTNSMMGMPMGAMGMGGMGAMGMNMPQMGGGMGMQGMPGSYNHPHVSPIPYYGPSAAPAVRSIPQDSQIRQNMPSASKSISSQLSGGVAPGIGVNPSSKWAGYTQYSLTSSTSPSPSFPSHTTASSNATVSFPLSAMLKQEQSSTGNQAHFNPAFFPQGQAAVGAGDASWNPHGAKRTRQE